MKYQLSKSPKIPYSLFEYQLFETLPKNGDEISSADLTEMRRKQGPWHAKNQRAVITTMMGKLTKTIEANNEPFHIKKIGKEKDHWVVEYHLAPGPAPKKKKKNGK